MSSPKSSPRLPSEPPSNSPPKEQSRATTRTLSASPKTISPGPDPPKAHADDEDDCTIAESVGSLTVSVSSSILNYRRLYGRTYQNVQTTEYWAPNDEQQNHGLDLTHNALLMLLDDKLFLAPIGEHPKRVLDIGTGTGIWAINFGDEFPEAEITGTDLSPIQPTWLPPNVKFLIEDCLLDWAWPEDHFDFIHIRAMYGSVPDWVDLYKKAYTHLMPGGWIQDLEMDVRIQSDLVDFPPDHIFNRWADLFYLGGEKMGRPFDVCKGHSMRDNLAAAGFVDITERKIKAPMHAWSNNAKMQQVGSLFQMALEDSVEGYAVLMLMDIMGWYREEVMVLLGLYRAEMRKKSNCGWVETTVVYGRKPVPPQETDVTAT